MANKKVKTKPTESDYKREEKSVSARLAAQPKVSIYIHDEEQKRWEGNLGGVSLLIPTNKWVTVPEDVARLIELNKKVRMENKKIIDTYKGSGPKLAEY
jgi:hypothetical protein